MGSPLGSPEDVSSTGRAVRKMFAAVAPRYDFLNHFLSLGCDLYWRRATAKALGHALARPKSVAVDVCCGTGDLALALARVSSGKVIGADFCHPMLERALEKARRGPLRTRASGGPVGHAVFFLEADTLALPFRNDSVDVVSIVSQIERHFRIRLSQQELERLVRVGDLLDLLMAKLSAPPASSAA